VELGVGSNLEKIRNQGNNKGDTVAENLDLEMAVKK
jgi:hypothetical protein